jgi:hypothetical protein
MERQFNNGDFEKLLRENANQYRMYPSEKVWDGVHSALHTRRRWYGFTVLILLLISGSVTSYFVFSNSNATKNIAEKNAIVKKQVATPVSTISNYNNVFTPEIDDKSPAAKQYDLNAVIEKTPAINLASLIAKPESDQQSKVVAEVISLPVFTQEEKKTETIVSLPVMTIPEKQNIEATIINSSENTEGLADKTINIENSIDAASDMKLKEAIISSLASQNISIPAAKKQPRITAQVYFTPTVSYRKLTENKKIYTAGGVGFNYVPTIDLNNIVQHKPAMGLEFGIEGKYRMDDKISLKAGLQFNINRYDIRAYSHPTEIATVAVTSGLGVDSLATLSNYRNFSGNSPNWLENFYFQVAFPMGGEVILSNKKNFKWGISATIQPTYVLGDRAYVISSDYKNYAKFPDLMRRWNLSTGFGTFVSYSTGRINWQVGPHVRYQHLSSFVSALSVKEKLFSAGLRVGATFNKKK